ncbi:ligase-associated DNA damage response endonuclease PdeM [Cryomorphaceae bacterium 1068]|nr:ligase-associated DNA damage response endonuclease PdeM [Cryomorphaceae bacterium 1068]
MVYEIQKTKLSLLPERAIFWEEKKMLIVADAHIGKVSHFRKNGIPVPGMAERNNLWRLSGLVLKTQPKQIIFLGDLSHSKLNKAWDQFVDFRNAYSNIKMTLVKGNHDILSDQAFEAANISLVDRMSSGPFLFTHDREESDFYNIHGHIHPSIRLRGMGRQSLRVPCYFFGKDYGILPSFGDFTGSFTLKPAEGDAVFVPAENETMRVF